MAINARGNKSLRSARWHVCSLSLASLLLLSVLAVQRSLPSVSDRHLHTLAQIRPPMLQDYSPHAKALGNHHYFFQ